MWYIMVGVPLGYLGGRALLPWARHLLAHVPQTEAAPVALGQAGSVAVPLESPAARLPLTLSPVWQATARWGLLALTPLALWRGMAQAHHLPPWLAALVLSGGVAFLLVAAVVDGAAHLIFAEVLAIPAGVALLCGLHAGVAGPLLMGGLVGGGGLLALYAVGQFIYETDALGWGDVQLGVALGTMLGWPGIGRALLGGMLLLLVVTLTLLALRRITTRSYLPLGSFLLLGGILVLLTLPLPWL